MNPAYIKEKAPTSAFSFLGLVEYAGSQYDVAPGGVTS